MAEGLLRAYGGADYEVYSAGTQPRPVHPLAIKVMEEMGIDISEHAGHRAKGMEEFINRPSMDLVITLCNEAAEECPCFPNTRRQLHWSFPDPSAVRGTEKERLAIFRYVRDLTALRIDKLIRMGSFAQSPRKEIEDIQYHSSTSG
jgi:arsenate reductase